MSRKPCYLHYEIDGDRYVISTYWPGVMWQIIKQYFPQAVGYLVRVK